MRLALLLATSLIACGGRLDPIDDSALTEDAGALDAADAACTYEYGICVEDCAAISNDAPEYRSECIAEHCSCGMVEWF